MRRYGKIAVALSLSAALAGTSVATGIYAAETEDTETEQLTEAQAVNGETEALAVEDETEETEQEGAQTEVEKQDTQGSAETGITKDEMVYVLAGADGSVQKIIVSDWLKNIPGSETIDDRSELIDIENVKGEESFTAGEDNVLVWDAQGSDIYYQGTTDKELPVEVAISYKLDGESISPEELAGKSGKLTIRFDYTNKQYEEVEIDGEKEKIYVPFAMLTGALFDDNALTNVEVTNGKLVGDGAHAIAVGVAFPGLQEDLGISEEKFEIPDYVEITGDAENFEPGMTVTVASNELVNALVNEADIDEAEIKETLEESVGELLSAMDQLESGAGSLATGAGDLDTGAASLQEGVAQLSDGLSELAGNNDSLNEGAKQVFETLLSTANEQIAASGLDVPELTIENYAETLDGVIVTLNADVKLGQALGAVMGTGTEQVDAAQAETAGENEAQTGAAGMTDAAGMQAQAGIEALTELKASLDSYNTFYLGLQSYTEGVAKSAEGAGDLKTGADSLKDGADQLSARATQLYDGILALTGGEKSQNENPTEDAAAAQTDAEAPDESQDIKELLETAGEDLDGLTARLLAMKEVSENYQSFAGIDESMSGQVRFIYRTDSASLSK